MSKGLAKTFKKLLKERKAEALKTGVGEMFPLAFHEKGKYLEQNKVRRVYERILSKAGLRRLRFPDIRDTFASPLVSNGESPVYVKEQMGHSSIQMNVDIYGHLIPGSNKSAVDRLDETQPDATYAQPGSKENAAGD